MKKLLLGVAIMLGCVFAAPLAQVKAQTGGTAPAAPTSTPAPDPAAAAGASSSNDSKDAVCKGLSITGGKCGGGAETTVSTIIKTAIQIFQLIIGIIAVFTIITAGLNYITSGGDSGKTATAKNRILYAAIGLVVVALAQIIVQFILNRV
jgi:Type IV secretion system pilin